METKRKGENGGIQKLSHGNSGKYGNREDRETSEGRSEKDRVRSGS